ncbi:MAG TPA: oligoendopeptidase F [Symbiobacteriaceae bacterium]|nr:oligoendopeptidase F [Symbiobacteriaceae bacterium]
MQKRLTRPEVPVELRWSVEDLFPTREVWAAELAAVEAETARVAAFKGRLGEGADILQACLDAQEAVSERIYRLYTYAGLKAAEDGSDAENQELDLRAGSLAANAEAAFSFIRSELLALPEGSVERWMESNAKLAELRPYIERMLTEKPYMLSPETEEAVAALGEVHHAPSMIYERAKSSDIHFESFADGEGKVRELSFALYEEDYEGSVDAATRRNAFRAFSRGLNAYKNTLAATWATEVKKNVVLARLRKYPSATHMLLQPHQVSPEAYHNLHDIIQTELAPHMRRLVNLRKRVLGLDQMLYCDIEAPLDPTYNPSISRDEASKLVLEALEVMGPEYGKIMRTALKERWVDWADNVGKSTGAFCASPYGAHSYILLTWTDNMRGAFTLAHELGHAGHFQLANRYQRLFNTEPSTYFVEAPSTMNELLLGQHILAKSTDVRMRRWVILQFMATYHHNFVRHLLEGELQRRMYALAEKGTPITANTLCEAKGAILEQFWGDAVTVDEGARLTWMRQPHYYMGLYPYTYSAGLTAATAMAQMIREEGEPAVQRWLNVLRAGGTRRPLDLLAMAGIDMSKPEPIRKAVAYVGSLVDELEKSFE